MKLDRGLSSPHSKLDTLPDLACPTKVSTGDGARRFANEYGRISLRGGKGKDVEVSYPPYALVTDCRLGRSGLGPNAERMSQTAEGI